MAQFREISDIAPCYGLLVWYVQPRKLLVIDHNTDSGTLLVRTLIRKFPLATVQLCGDAATAADTVATERFDAIVLHRTAELTGAELIQTLRCLNSNVPIVAVSGIDREAESVSAGANAFLQYDEWLRIGNVVQSVLPARGGSKSPFEEKAAETSSELV